jgi:hypothetical protein
VRNTAARLIGRAAFDRALAIILGSSSHTVWCRSLRLPHTEDMRLRT